MRQIRLYEPRDRGAALACFRSNLPEFFAADEFAAFTTWTAWTGRSSTAFRPGLDPIIAERLHEG